MLEIKKLTVHYGPLPALKEVSLEIEKGEIVSLIGPNRAGKTTLLLTLSGILETTEGRIYFEEGDITNLSPHRIVSKGLIHVPQGRHVFPTLSVLDNLFLGAYAKRKEKERLEKGLEGAFRLFPKLGERKNQRAGTLSGGEQQMLAIGRALMGKPKLLVLDEPSLGLAPHFTGQIFDALKKMNQDGLTLFIVEQEIHLTLSISHRGYVLKNGRIIREGLPPTLLESQEIKDLISI
jgi:branched-chain amino acid transport system ATP-binding protein